MAKQSKGQKAIEAIGFDSSGQVAPLAPLKPLNDTGMAIGFDDPTASGPNPLEGPTPSEQYTPGYRAGTSLEDTLAKNQHGWDQFANFLEQTGVSALTGTVEAGSYMLDFEQHINMLKGVENEYSNAVADQMKQWNEANKEAMPIYLSDKNKGFEPTSAEWWANNGASGLGTVLGLLIPAAGAAKLGKLAGLGELGQTITATVFSRIAENTMEAAPVYEEAFKTLKAQGLSDEEASKRAGDAAAKVYNTNWVFALQDFAQFAAISKGFGSVAKGKKGLGFGELLKQMAGEGAEEAGQYVVSEEGKRTAAGANVDYFGDGFTKRLSDYIHDDEFKTSTLLGAVGGGLFHGVGKATDIITDEPGLTDRVQDWAKQKMRSIVGRGIQKEQANTVDDTGTSRKTDDINYSEMLVNKYNEGKINEYKTQLEAWSKDTKDTDARESFKKYIEDIDYINTEEAKMKTAAVPEELRKGIILNKLEQRQNARMDEHLTKELDKTYGLAITTKQLPVALQEIKKAQMTYKAYQQLASKFPTPELARKVNTAKQNYDKLLEPDMTIETKLGTDMDDTLLQKTFQLITTREKQEALKQEGQEFGTPEGIQKYKAKKAAEKMDKIAEALLADPKATIQQMNEAAKLASDSIAKQLMLKIEGVKKLQQQENEEKTKSHVDGPQAPEDTFENPSDTFTNPEDSFTGPDESFENPDSFSPPEDQFPDDMQYPDEYDSPDIDFAGGLDLNQASWAGLDEDAVNDIISRLDLEQKVPDNQPPTEQKDKDDRATEETLQRTTVPAWLKEINKDGSKTEYTDNRTGEKITADQVFAIDEQTGQLLANTPKVRIGDKVILRHEDDFPFTLTPGFKPTGRHNSVINVYIEGVDKPIKQLPSENNEKTEGQAVIKQLREAVLNNGGYLQTTIVGKNVGSIRMSPVANSIQVLQSDFVEVTPGHWEMQKLEHNPALGFIDFNGNIIIPNLGAMKGMSIKEEDAIKNTKYILRTNDLKQLKGKTVTFRTAPDGTKRIIGLQPRLLNETELGWIYNNLPQYLASKTSNILHPIVHIPKHSTGVYSTNKGTKKPDLLKLSRNKVHVVTTTDKTSDVLIPLVGKGGAKIWISVESKYMNNFLNDRGFTFRVIDEEGDKITVAGETANTKAPIIVERFKQLMSKQFRNVDASQLNSEIPYTDPIDPTKQHSSYYDYLINDQAIQTSQPGSLTLGYGDDSSFSFNQVAVYLDPNPSTPRVEVDKTSRTIIEARPTPIPEPAKEEKKNEDDDVHPLDLLYGPDAQNRQFKTIEGYNLITEKELQWFKDNIGEEFLEIAKGVDRFMAANGVVSFGQHYNSLVTIAEYAAEGTAYHEAFHFVFRSLLTPKERAKILEGTTEEKLAEEFERYMLSGGKLRVAPKARGFFSRLFTMIKKILGFRHPIEKLFSKIDNLALSQEQKMEIMDRAKSQIDPNDPQFKKLPGFKWIKQQQDSIQGFTSEIMNLANQMARDTDLDVTEVLVDKKNLDQIMYGVINTFRTDLVRIMSIPVKDRVLTDVGRYYNYLAMGIATPDQLSTIPEKDKSFVGEFEDPKTSAGYPTDGFKTKVLKDLSRYGFRVKLSDGTVLDGEGLGDEQEQAEDDAIEMKLEDEGERLYDIDHTLINPAKSMSQRMKLFISSIPEPVIGEDNTITDRTKNTIFGTPKFMDGSKVDAALTLKLRDSINPITRLTELSKTDPIVKVIYDRLMYEKNKGNLQLYNEFASKYNRDGYYKKTILYTRKTVPLTDDEINPGNPNLRTKVVYSARTIDSDRGSADRTLSNRWRGEAVNKKVIDTDGAVNLQKANALLKKLKTFEVKYAESINKRNRLPYTQLKDELVSLMKEIGVTIPDQVWQEIDELPNPGFKYSKVENWLFGERRRSVEQLFSEMTKGKDPFEGSSVLTDLARASAVYLADTRGGAYRNDEGNQENPINWPAPITEIFNQIKNNHREFVAYYRQDNFYTNNAFLDQARKENNGIDLSFTSTSRINDNDPKAFANRTEIDSLIMRFTTFFNNLESTTQGWFFVGTASDKTKQAIVSLPKYKGPQARNFLQQVLKNTAKSEVVRIQRLKADYQRVDQALPVDIANYKNNARFLYVPELNKVPDYAEVLYQGDVSSEQYLAAEKEANRLVDAFIDAKYNQFVLYLRDNDLVTTEVESSGERTVQATSKMPKALYADKSLNEFLREFFYNDLGWRMSMSQVLMGDYAFYKNADDYFKRAYQLVTPGIKPINENSKGATRAVYTKQYKRNTEEAVKQWIALGVNEKTARIYEAGTDQKGVNKTDAQSLIHIDAYRTITNALGLWQKNTHERIYNFAWSKGITARKGIQDALAAGAITPEEATELRRVAAETLMQPLKPFQFNNRMITLPDGKMMLVKEQFKDSITPITPELATVHEGYNHLLSYMKANNVDIMSAEDTLKVGGYGVITDFSTPLEDWQKRLVPLEDFRFPQLMPEKKKEEISGTQLHKLIMGNINDKTIYMVAGKQVSGEDIKKAFNTIWAKKIADSSVDLQERLGVGEDFKLSEEPKKRREQMYKLKLVLQQELLSRDLNENYQDVLDLVNGIGGATDFVLPLSFPAFGQKFQQVLTNLWKKAVLRQKSTGYSAINLADFGVGYSDELKFITNTNGEVTEAEIGLPIDYVGEIGLKYGEHILPNGTIMWDKLSDNQKEALQFIVYRIPTSNKSSMLPVRVAKITPPQLNNIVIIPGELTIQQGLDFDVDKSQLLKRVLNKTGKVDYTAPDTQLFDIYWGILTNKAHIQELMTPLATPMLEAKVAEYATAGLVPGLGGDISVFTTNADVDAEIRNKDGKAEIGTASRFNTGHAILQNIRNFIGVRLGIDITIPGVKYEFNELGRDKDALGTFISENYGETQQAALDAAKNPLLAYVNVVKGTIATFETMVGFGVPLNVVTDFFMQPVLREWTKFYKQEGQMNNKATDKLYSVYPDLKGWITYFQEQEKPGAISSEDLTKNVKSNVMNDAKHSARVLFEFLKINNMARQMTRINNVLSIDTFQDATGIEALEAMAQTKGMATDQSEAIYIDPRIFDMEKTPIEGKRLASFYHYGIDNAIDYVGQFFPSASPQYQEVINHFAGVTGQERITDKEVIKNLHQFTNYFALQGDSLLSRTLTTIHPIQGKDYRDRWKLFDKNYSIWNYINRMLDKYPGLKSNELLKNLESSRTMEDKAVLVSVRSSDKAIVKSEMTAGWDELLASNNVEIKTLGHDLVRYSIMTSGFNYGTGTMFDLVPVDFWVSSGLGAAWQNFADTIGTQKMDSDAIVTNYIRHNFKTMDRFPEAYVRYSEKKGYSSVSLYDIKIHPKDNRHITSFNYVTLNNPRFLRVMDNELDDYRLYESSPEDETYYKEVQPLGQRLAFYEISADGRNRSFHPGNQRYEADPNPWSKPDVHKMPVTFTFFPEGNLKYHSLLEYFPTVGPYSAKEILTKLAVNETSIEGKNTVDALLRNADKIDTPLSIENEEGTIGAYLVYENGHTEIKISPMATLQAPSKARQVLIHELVHAFSVGVIQNPIGERQEEFVRNIGRLRESATKNADTEYGLTSNEEFVAELASSPKFRAGLRKKGLWARLLRNIRKLFGFKDQYDKFLDELYSVLDEAQASDIKPKHEGKYSLATGETAKEKVAGQKRIDLLQQMLSSLNAREKYLTSRGEKTKANKLFEDIKTLDELVKTNREQAVVAYMAQTEREVQKLSAQIEVMGQYPTNITADTLYAIREQLSSYKILDDFSDLIRRDPQAFVIKGGNPEVMLKSLDALRANVHRLLNDTHKMAVRFFAGIVMKTLNNPELTLENVIDQLEVADRDIAWVNMMTQSGMDINDVAVQTVAKILKDNESNAYRNTQSRLYDQAPQKRTAYVATRVPNETLEGYHYDTVRIDYTTTSMNKALGDYEKWLKENGKNPNSLTDKFAPIIDMDSVSANEDGVHLISPTSKEGKRILALPDGHPLKQFYETFVLEYLRSQEQIHPRGMRPGLRVPSIGRSLFEGLKTSKGLSDVWGALQQSAIDKVRKRYDETDFKAVDQNGNPQNYVPVRFIAKQDGKEGRLSTREVSLDLGTTLPLFIHEMDTRAGLTKVASELELGKMVLAERSVMKTKRIKGPGLTGLLSSDREGITLESGKLQTIPGEQSNSFAAVDSLLRRILYGQSKKSEGDVEIAGKKFSLSKTIDSFLGFTGFRIMFGNFAIPLTNAIVGEATMVKELIGGNIINKSQWLQGKKYWVNDILPSLKDAGQREKKTKASRIFDYFNPMDNQSAIGDMTMASRRGKATLNTITRTFGNITDHFMAASAVGAVFAKFSAVGPDGKNVRLDKVLEVSESGTVKLADGYTYRGKKSISDKEVEEVKQYSVRLFQIMNGVYNKMDKPAMNEFVVGRLLGFMRSWLKSGVDARWRTKFYDERLRQQNEGHYVSSLVIFNNMFADKGVIMGTVHSLKAMFWMGNTDPKLLLLPNERALPEQEQEDIINLRKSNMRKTTYELIMWATLSLLLHFGWDDDEEDSYARYMMARVRREISTFFSPATAWDVLRSPTVALNSVEAMGKVWYDLIKSGGSYFNGEEQPIYKHGPKKGENKLYIDTMNSLGLGTIPSVGFYDQFQDLDTKTRLIVRGYR